MTKRLTMGLALSASLFLSLTGCQTKTEVEDPTFGVVTPEVIAANQARFEELKAVYELDLSLASNLSWNEETGMPNTYEGFFIKSEDGYTRYGTSYALGEAELEYLDFIAKLEDGYEATDEELLAISTKLDTYYEEISLTEQSMLMSVFVAMELMAMDDTLNAQTALYLVDDAAYYSMLVQAYDFSEDEMAELLKDVYLFHPETYALYGRLEVVQIDGAEAADAQSVLELRFIQATDEMKALFEASDFFELEAQEPEVVDDNTGEAPLVEDADVATE